MYENQSKSLAFSVIAIVLLFLCSLCWLHRSNGTEHVQNQRVRIDEIRAELADAQKQQRDIQQGIKQAAERAADVEKRIDSATERTDSLAGKVSDDRAVIEECESILRAVRQRGKE